MKTEKVHAKGHRNITSLHRNTLEFTKETRLTPRGDCIVAVAADKGLADLSNEFKARLKKDGTRLDITIECGVVKDTVTAYGSPNLILTHPTDMVVRKTDYICPRTLAIKADKAAGDMDRRLVEELKNGGTVTVSLGLH